MILGDVFSNLGNQLFIYAATKCIALDLGYDYRYRVVVPSFAKSDGAPDEFGHEYSSHFESAFNIDTRERVDAVPAEVGRDWEWIISPESNYDPSVYEVGDNTRLHGYFQSPRYFDHHREAVQRWFTPRPGIAQWAANRRQDILERAGAQVLCGVHVRRGPDYKRWNRMLGAEYYLRALQLVAAEYGTERMAIALFTDVPREARRLPGLAKGVFSGGTVNEDLCLMMRCDALVVANSSLSWWGGWLGEQDRLIVRPSVWPLPEDADQAIDVCPDAWAAVKAERDNWRPSVTSRSSRALAAAVRRGRRLLIWKSPCQEGRRDRPCRRQGTRSVW